MLIETLQLLSRLHSPTTSLMLNMCSSVCIVCTAAGTLGILWHLLVAQSCQSCLVLCAALKLCEKHVELNWSLESVPLRRLVRVKVRLNAAKDAGLGLGTMLGSGRIFMITGK